MTKRKQPPTLFEKLLVAIDPATRKPYVLTPAEIEFLKRAKEEIMYEDQSEESAA